jgi:hypothetical protein
MKPKAIFPMCLLMSVLCGAAGADEPRLNQIQAIGSHNSYHLAPPAAVLTTIGTLRRDAAEAWNYSHPPLGRQLSEAGVRQIELDIYADSRGGRFSDPLALKLANLAGAKLPPCDPELGKPGFKILHVPDIDCWSNTATLVRALAELAAWSAAHPEHLPVMVLIECEDTAHPPLPTRPEPFTRERLLELDAAILKGLPREKLLLPDDVRGAEPTLRDAIARRGWPTVAAARGKFLFALDNTNAIRDRYLEGNPALENRVLFVSAPDRAHPAAGWFKRNDPRREFDDIQQLVKRGFLVRTRADESTPDAAQRERAFASGAQWVSTDHFAAGLPAAIRVVFPDGGMVRPNPLNGETIGTLAP